MRHILIAALVAAAAPAFAEEVGSFRNDWTGNSIVVEAVHDPKSTASPAISRISIAA